MSGEPHAPGPDLELEALWTAVRQRHGARLGEAELADLRQSVEGIVALVRALRRVPLANADAPLEILVPFRADTGPPT
jgi:hypothetical protein